MIYYDKRRVFIRFTEKFYVNRLLFFCFFAKKKKKKKFIDNFNELYIYVCAIDISIAYINNSCVRIKIYEMNNAGN